MIILVVDDEETIVNNICAYLENSGHNTLKAFDGEQALQMFFKFAPDLIILDLMLPKLMGEEVCKRIRTMSNVPIIMLTAKSSEDSKVYGLDIGADDYITKPFSNRELMSRVNSILRRVQNFKTENYVSFNDGDLQINYQLHSVLKNGKECKLTTTERELLFMLSKFSKKTFSRDELINYVLGSDFDGYDRVIDTHIKNLRYKIEDNTANPKYIITVRGVGYRFGGELL